MKNLQGNIFNITNDIVGKITFNKHNFFDRYNYIFVSDDIKKIYKGYSATITNNTNIIISKLPYCKVADTSSFKEGDVVLINSKSEIIFLYERESNSNFIIATEKCNHHCIMCPQPPVAEEIDRTNFNLNFISLLDKDTKEIGITGGEPTMIGDKLFLLIQRIQRKLPKTSITILSNGVKFSNKDYALKLAMCKHKDLQIDIPLFSDIAKEHNRIVGAETFYKTIKGLYNLALFNQKIGIRIVVNKLTYKRLPQFANFIYHNFPFVSQVAFMQMETMGLANQNIEDLWIDPYDYNKQLEEAVLLLDERQMNPYIYNSQLCILPESIRKYAQKSISNWKDIYLSSCDNCILRGKCAGLFLSNKKYHSKHICKIESK